MQEKGALADKVKLFTGIIFSGDELNPSVIFSLEKFLGKTDYKSPPIPFDVTDYYSREMGNDLKRIFLSFEKLINPQDITDIKIRTDEIELKYTDLTGRKVNIDPGYMDYYKVVLASKKMGGQKIYLNKGVWADITLLYEKGTFKPLDWGFPDFKSGVYNDILCHIRKTYKGQRKKESIYQKSL